MATYRQKDLLRVERVTFDILLIHTIKWHTYQIDTVVSALPMVFCAIGFLQDSVYWRFNTSVCTSVPFAGSCKKRILSYFAILFCHWKLDPAVKQNTRSRLMTQHIFPSAFSRMRYSQLGINKIFYFYATGGSNTNAMSHECPRQNSVINWCSAK